MKGISDIRLRIKCANVYDHAKILPIASFLKTAPGSLFAALDNREADRTLKLYFAQRIGEILCGTSQMYIYKPAARSPIGKCVLCGGALSFEVQEWEGEKRINQKEAASA
jgi:hypothetical protein